MQSHADACSDGLISVPVYDNEDGNWWDFKQELRNSETFKTTEKNKPVNMKCYLLVNYQAVYTVDEHRRLPDIEVRSNFLGSIFVFILTHVDRGLF